MPYVCGEPNVISRNSSGVAPGISRNWELGMQNPKNREEFTEELVFIGRAPGARYQ